jgi:hypothetical protein
MSLGPPNPAVVESGSGDTALGRLRQREAPDAEVLQGLGADDQPDGLTDPLSQLLRVIGRKEAKLDGDEDGRSFHVADDIHRMVH